MLSLSPLAFGGESGTYSYDSNRLKTCINQVKQAYASFSTAQDARIGLLTRYDGFNRVYVTYQHQGQARMDVLWMQLQPCQAMLLTTVNLLNQEQHAAEVKKRGYCERERGQDLIFPGSSYAQDASAGFADLGNEHHDAATYVETLPGRQPKHVAYFRTLDADTCDTDGLEVETFSVKDDLSVKCQGGVYDPCELKTSSSGNASVSDSNTMPALSNNSEAKSEIVGKAPQSLNSGSSSAGSAQ